ncbi:flavodoxin FldA [Phocaeicola barnesiae]|uniref:flavodoxin FldA n=1 Tax=Phocaeicola barnesiae TaxID=376804 RepID=UPI001F18DDD7|nr:flavodoxin FldA [Phocaeicola barnesiae]MCF2575062.1 flavodoxin FldA [Phocaeicola barnesiae]
MKRIGIIYGSTTGTCESLANQLATCLGVSDNDVHSADKLTDALVSAYDVLILGTSTWGDGELQDDWYDGIKVLKQADLNGKTVALFGCGDSEAYCDTFCDGMGILYEDLKDSGCTFLGNRVSTDDYTFSSSIAVVDGTFVGLALDDVNESAKTAGRIQAWADELKHSL